MSFISIKGSTSYKSIGALNGYEKLSVYRLVALSGDS